MSQDNTDTRIEELALNFVEVTSNALGAATKLAEDAERQQKSAGEKVPTVLERLKSAGLIDTHDSVRAEGQLGNHAQALDILLNVVNHYEKQANQKSASDELGTPVEGSATMRKQGNYVGQRRGIDSAPSEADDMLYNRLVG